MESHFCAFCKGFAKFSRDPYYEPLTRVHDTCIYIYKYIGCIYIINIIIIYIYICTYMIKHSPITDYKTIG